MAHSEHSPSDKHASASLSDAAKSVWAKSDYEDPTAWLPLYLHMSDAAAVADILWRNFLPPATKEVLSRALDDDPGLAHRVVVWLAAAHDTGKASPSFCIQVDALRDRAEAAGLTFHPSVRHNRSKLPHAAASFHILVGWMTRDRGLPHDQAVALAAIPLGHHGTFQTPASEFADGSLELLGTGTLWETVQDELAAYAAQVAGLTIDDFARLAEMRFPQPAAVVATGVTILADWIASNTEFFPLRTVPRSPDAAEAAMARLGLPRPWAAEVPTDDTLFGRHLGLDNPRPLQVGLVELARSLPTPELLILEAPTGEGKTKAGLGASEVLAARFGLGGVLFALPTQATSDGIFPVVRDWLASVESTTDVSLSLAHGKAAFNADYQKIPRTSTIFETDASHCDGRAVAHWFLTGRGKLATMSDFVVGTIDQLLLAALCAKHVALRHLGVTGKVVVIDEIHAADTFMRQYLCRMLTWLATYNVPVIAMSATLTPSIRYEFIKAYNAGRSRRTPRDCAAGTAYPRITHTDPLGATTVELPASSRTSTIDRRELAGSTDVIAAEARRAASQGGNVAVICNTVRRAQDVFRTLRDHTKSSDVDLVLLHSRFLTPERMTKEQELRDRLGPSSQRSQKSLIVVATQVIEQSLDIDFDAMFSDIAPIDLLLQRAGRLHRHEWKHPLRPDPHRSATLVLTGFDRVDGGPPRLERGCVAVYGALALLRSLATLDEHFSSHESITSPGDVSDLVARAYETIEAPAGWEDAWLRAEERDADLQHEKRRTAQGFLIPEPSRRDLVGWAGQPAPDATGERAVAQVRDAEDSIEVVVIQRINDRPVIPTWAVERPGAQVDFATVIDDEIAVSAAKNTLRLPGYLGSAGIGDQLIDDLEQNCIDSWQNSRWLRGVLPLILDVNGDAEHAGHLFHYDTDLGLVVNRLENS